MVTIVKVGGSPSDNAGNKIENLFDASPDTRYSSANGFINLTLDGGEFNALDIRFFKGDKRKTKFNVGVTDDTDLFQSPINLGDFESNGTTIDTQRFVFDKTYKNKALIIKFVSNNDNSNWLSLTELRVVLTTDKPTDHCECKCPCCVEPHPEPKPEPKPDPKPEPKPEPTPTGGKEIALVYPAKQGGQRVTKFSGAKRSSHNTGKRDSFYSEPKSAFTAVNGQVGLYLRFKLSTNDQGCIKILSGGHGSSPLQQGCCYAVGIQINMGKASTPHLAKEYPKHPDTPKFPKQVKLLYKQALPDINNKTVGYRLTYYVTEAKTLKGRLDIDLSVLDTLPKDLKECPNKFVPWFEFEDKGDWVGPALIENQGVKHKGSPLGYYIRIDKVTDASSAAFEQAVEIVPPKV